MRRHQIIRISLFLLYICTTTALSAHAVHYRVEREQQFKIAVTMGSGEPMSNADVLVFAPGERTPQQRLKTDEVGVFRLAPGLEGTWIMQIKDDTGHAVRINLPVNAEELSTSNGRGNHLTLLQKIIMLLLTGWAAVATALLFSRRKRR